MSVPAPHFHLYSEAALASEPAALAAAEHSSGLCKVGRWRFVLRLPGGETSLEAADAEPADSPERLELLAVIRGLEALDQPSRVTLVSATRNIQRGLKFGLSQWRENDWHWERYGKLTPVKHGDLWQRLDRLLAIHSVECRTNRLEKADDLAPPPRQFGGKRLRFDRAAKHETNSKHKCRNNRNTKRLEHSSFVNTCLFRISCFVLRVSSLFTFRTSHPTS